jgi:hypothetical protein
MDRSRLSEQFSADGYVVVSTTIDPEFTREVTAASEWANQVLSGSRRGFQQDFYNSADVARHLQYPHLHSESCLALLRSRPVAEVARSVFGDSRMLVTHSKISHKKAGADLAWFPHQDNGYKAGTNEPERRGMTIGIFLEDADERARSRFSRAAIVSGRCRIEGSWRTPTAHPSTSFANSPP